MFVAGVSITVRKSVVTATIEVHDGARLPNALVF